METSAANIPANERSLDDGDTTWRVYQVTDHKSASLVFESDRIVRRVRAFPKAWLSLPQKELLALSWKR